MKHEPREERCPRLLRFASRWLHHGGPSAFEITANFKVGPEEYYRELEAVIAQVRMLASPLGRELRFWKQFRVVLGDTDADAWQTVSFLRARAHDILTALPDEAVRSSAQFARDRERGLGTGVDMREAAARQLSATFDGLIVGSVDRVYEHIAAYRRAGITVINVDALTETDHDRSLRRQLIAEITRNETISQP